METETFLGGKMKRVLNVVLGCAILLISTALVLAHGNAHATEKISVNGAEISVDYHRPSLNGRSESPDSGLRNDESSPGRFSPSPGTDSKNINSASVESNFTG